MPPAGIQLATLDLVTSHWSDSTCELVTANPVTSSSIKHPGQIGVNPPSNKAARVWTGLEGRRSMVKVSPRENPLTGFERLRLIGWFHRLCCSLPVFVFVFSFFLHQFWWILAKTNPYFPTYYWTCVGLWPSTLSRPFTLLPSRR